MEDKNMKTNEKYINIPNGQRAADEEYIINGCKVRLYYAEHEKEDDEAVMKTIEQYLTENWILASRIRVS